MVNIVSVRFVWCASVVSSCVLRFHSLTDRPPYLSQQELANDTCKELCKFPWARLLVISSPPPLLSFLLLVLLLFFSCLFPFLLRLCPRLCFSAYFLAVFFFCCLLASFFFLLHLSCVHSFSTNEEIVRKVSNSTDPPKVELYVIAALIHCVGSLCHRNACVLSIRCVRSLVKQTASLHRVLTDMLPTHVRLCA